MGIALVKQRPYDRTDEELRIALISDTRAFECVQMSKSVLSVCKCEYKYNRNDNIDNEEHERTPSNTPNFAEYVRARTDPTTTTATVATAVCNGKSIRQRRI